MSAVTLSPPEAAQDQPATATSPALAAWLEDELPRLPALFDSVLDDVLRRWDERLPRAVGVGSTGRPQRLLRQRRADLVVAAMRSLRRSAEGRPARRADPSAEGAAPMPTLALVEDDDVQTDLEIARAIDALALAAADELRRLQQHLATLAGDPDIRRDPNPLRPEHLVRALADGVRALPVDRRVQRAFLQDAARPLASAARVAYGAAAERLARRGVVPAEHRTLIHAESDWAARRRLPPSAPAPADAPTAAARAPRVSATSGARVLPAILPAAPPAPGEDDDLHVWFDSQPLPLAPPRPPLRSAAAIAFDTLHHAIVADPTLTAELRAIVVLARPLLSRLVEQRPSRLDDAEDLGWRLLDTLVHRLQAAAGAERQRLAAQARDLLTELSADTGAQADARLPWALERLAANDRLELDRAIIQASPTLARLAREQQAARDGREPTQPAALDVSALLTVPADLMPQPETTPQPSHPLMNAEPGSFWRACLQAEWRTLQLLVGGDSQGAWLLREPLAGDRLWALRAGVLESLARERLITPLRCRSLARRAAARLRG